jgi:hypothetical protein
LIDGHGTRGQCAAGLELAHLTHSILIRAWPLSNDERATLRVFRKFEIPNGTIDHVLFLSPVGR